MRLRKCICGGIGIKNDTSNGDLAFVSCSECLNETLAWNGMKRAEKNWNGLQRKLLKEKKEN